MKEGLHPEYEKVTIKCACGAELVDTGGRVDRFNKRFNIGK